MSTPLPPLADVDDLADRLGRELADNEVDRAEAALSDASAMVREEARRDFAEGPPAAIQAVVLTASLRVMRNPEGFVQEMIGAYSYRRREEDTSVYLTAAEKAICARYRNSGGSGLWTQGTTRGEPCYDETIWYEDSYGSELFPLDSASDFRR
jgi:hypothetical protein